MKSVKYIIVLVSNAFLLGFVMYLTRDPLERWLMDWFWAETIVDVLFQTMFAGFILGAWLFVKHSLHWEFSLAKRIGIAIGLALLVNGHAYWKCVNEWYHRDAYPDRTAMIAKIYRFGYGTEGRNLTVDEYALIARRYDWGRSPPPHGPFISLATERIVVCHILCACISWYQKEPRSRSHRMSNLGKTDSSKRSRTGGTASW